MKAAELVVQVQCLHCRHKSILSNQDLIRFGVQPEAPVASFVKRLYCSNCGSGSVMVNRVAVSERAARRLQA